MARKEGIVKVDLRHVTPEYRKLLEDAGHVLGKSAAQRSPRSTLPTWIRPFRYAKIMKCHKRGMCTMHGYRDPFATDIVITLGMLALVFGTIAAIKLMSYGFFFPALSVAILGLLSTVYGWYSLPFWLEHRRAEKQALLASSPDITRPPEQLVIEYLRHELAAMREELLGGDADLPKIQLKLSDELAEMRTLEQELVAAIASCQEARFKVSLETSLVELRGLIARVDQSRARYEAHRATAEAYFRSADAFLENRRTPFRYHALIERVAAHSERVPEQLAEMEQAIVDSSVQLQAANEALRDKVRAILPAAVSTLTGASRQGLGRALDTCDSLMEDAFSDLPRLPATNI
ncbi:MAG: hypothetical protein Q7R83_01055 [bacterium]|nr:hypothetical protein [bacterium]